MSRVEDFLSLYPLPDDPNFAVKMFKREEFYELKLEPVEQVPSSRGEYLKHQRSLQRFMSPYTKTNGLLLFHGLGSGKCILPHTRILTSEGYMNAEEVYEAFKSEEKNDEENGVWSIPSKIIRIPSYDEESGKMVSGNVINLYKQKIDEEIISIRLEDGSEIKITQNHKLFSNGEWTNNFVEGQFIYSKSTKTFNELINSQLTYVKIISLEMEKYKGWVYDFEIEKYHNYVANGILCHNTCSAVAINENLRNYKLSNDINPRKTLILVKGKPLINNWIDEISTKCTQGQYLPKSKKSKKEYRNAQKKLVRRDYDITTYGVFINSLGDPSSKHYKQNISRYNDTLIIVDEIQNIRIQPGKRKTRHMYERMHIFLHTIERSKILLLSATPMWDQTNEIASVMNLILPSDYQLPTGNDFDKTYFTPRGKIKLDEVQNLKDHFRGRISYVRSTRTTAKIVQEGTSAPWFKYLRVYPSSLSEFQAQALKKATEQIKIEKVKRKKDGKIVIEERKIAGGTFHEWPRQASNFVWPDGSFTREAYRNNIDQKTLLIKPQHRQEIKNNLRKYSSKFFAAIEIIRNNPTDLIFVYTEFVTGSGAILFGALLNLYGFKRTKGSGTTPSTSERRYAIVTAETATDREVENIKNSFNSPENVNGDMIQVFIGSEKIGQGITLKRVNQIHILTPHWNLPSIDQAIGRALRLDSHLDVKPPVVVKIYRHVAVLSSPPESDNFLPTQTNDIQLYKKGEKKNFRNHEIERVIKESAIDCALSYSRNVLPQDDDGTVECDYRECNFVCDGLKPLRIKNGIFEYKVDPTDINYSTYDILYSYTKVRELTQKMKELFKNIFYIRTEDLLSYFGGEQSLIVLKTIDYLISNRILINNAYGFPSYVKEGGDLIFLDTAIGAKRQFSDAYYVERPFAIKTEELENIITMEEFKKDKRLLDKLMPLDKAKVDILLDKIHHDSLIMLVEIAHKITEASGGFSKKAKEIAEYILHKRRTNIFHLEDDTVVHNLYAEEYKGRAYSIGKVGLQLSGKMRCWDRKKKEWKWCTEKEERQVIGSIKSFVVDEEERMFDEHNKWGFYGKIVKETGNFKIVKKTPEGKRAHTGIVCAASVNKKDLIRMFIDADIHPPEDTSVKNLSKEQLINRLEKAKTRQLEPFMRNLSSQNTQYLKRLLILINNQRKQLCDWLQEWLKEKGYIITV